MQSTTKENIQKTFVNLLLQTDFNKISVREICLTANINRGTFYLHYLDKYDLLEQMQEKVHSDLHTVAKTEELNDIESLIDFASIKQTLTYVKDNVHAIQALIQVNSSHSSDRIKSFFRELIEVKIETQINFDISYPHMPESYVKEIIVSNISSIIYVWISRNAQETTDVIAEMILKSMHYAPLQLVRRENQLKGGTTP